MLAGDILYLAAGTAATWLLQRIKSWFKLSSRAMLWVSVIVCLALGFVVSAVTKDGGIAAILANPWMILTGGGAVFGTATVIYKEVAKRMQLPRPDEIKEES